MWWSCLAHPARHAWAEPDRPVRLVEQSVAKDDPDPTALACYGLLGPLVGPWPLPRPARRSLAAFRRPPPSRPRSSVTTQFLAWSCAKLVAAGKRALLLVWDNASWYLSKEGRAWLRAHNRAVHATGTGVRIVPCPLPIKSPWLNPIEPKWCTARAR